MRIGLDAKWFFSGPVSTRTILVNLLPELFKSYEDHEWIIFLDNKDKKCDFPFAQKNITVQYVWAESNLLSNIFVLPRYLKRLNIDIIVYQTFPAFKSSAPSIAFIHDVLFRDFPQFFTWKERLYFRPLSLLAKKATRLIATSEFVANDLVKYKYAKSRNHIDIVPLGVNKQYRPLKNHDPDSVKKIKEKYSLPNDFILYVGRLNTRKNIEALLKAMPYLENKIIPLVIVGEKDWKAPDLKKIVVATAIENRIIFTGRIATKELVIVYALAKVFCFPSFAEGFGLPPLEAMASGVPVVVSNTAAMPEVCKDAALYIDPREPNSIVRALNSLLQDHEKFHQLKNEGLKRAAFFSWEKTAKTFMQSILNAAQQNHP